MSAFAKVNIKSYTFLAGNKKTHKAAILYGFIAVRSNFTASKEAYIGDYEAMGLTRQEYRTACKNLEKMGYIRLYSKQRVGTVALLLK